MDLKKYADQISLFKPYIRPETYSEMGKMTSDLNRVIQYLLDELNESMVVPENPEEKKRLLRGLLNQRSPEMFQEEEGKLLDRILWTERIEKGIVPINSVPTVWRGDITQLNSDAIVNAANSDMLGCFHPLHACIDNCIHSAAGPHLREDCHKIIKLQGEKEETGGAKITRAYNLPSRFVLHTVGPIISGTVTAKQRNLLAACYTSCLNLAAQIKQIKSIAFCCISTGVFGYPKEEAALTAIQTVKEWKANYPERFDRIIFNVFTEEDHEIYQRHL